DEELRGGGAAADAARPRLARVDSFERTHLDLTLVAVPRRGGLEVELTYNEAVYPATQIRRVQRHLARLVELLAAQPEAACLELDWLPDDERQQLERWN